MSKATSKGRPARRHHLIVAAGGAGIHSLHALKGCGSQALAIDFDADLLASVRANESDWVTAHQPVTMSTSFQCDDDKYQFVEKALDAYEPKLLTEMQQTSCVTLLAGLGGVAGSWIAPRVAKLCKQLSLPLYMALLFPMKFEGGQRQLIAEATASYLQTFAVVALEVRPANMVPKMRPDALLSEYFDAVNELQRRLILSQ